MLLRSVRLEVRRQQMEEVSEMVPDVLARLCDTCNEAATRSLAILHSLQRQKTIRQSIANLILIGILLRWLMNFVISPLRLFRFRGDILCRIRSRDGRLYR